MASKLLADILADNTNESPTASLEMEDIKLAPLKDEIDLITDPAIRNFVRAIMVMAELFWQVPAAVVPGLHPPDEYGVGGNVLHTKRVIRTVWLMAESQNRTDLEMDVLLAAALLHDTTKVAEGPGGNINYDVMHPYTVERLVEFTIANDEKHSDTSSRSSTLELVSEGQDTLALIMRLVRTHQGHWSQIPETIPVTSLEWTLHLANQVADHLASLIDGPEIQEWRWHEPSVRPKNGSN